MIWKKERQIKIAKHGDQKVQKVLLAWKEQLLVWKVVRYWSYMMSSCYNINGYHPFLLWCSGIEDKMFLAPREMAVYTWQNPTGKRQLVWTVDGKDSKTDLKKVWYNVQCHLNNGRNVIIDSYSLVFIASFNVASKVFHGNFTAFVFHVMTRFPYLLYNS